MRKIIALMHLSLDGFAADANGGINWVAYNDEVADDVHQLIEQVDTAIYGRTTYQMMAGYWPTVLTKENAQPGELHHAQWVEAAYKVVFSTTLDKVEWNNAHLARGDVAGEIARLRQQPGKDMMIFGSPILSHEFMRLGLIDEYRLTISPVILGQGVPYFQKVEAAVPLKLTLDKTYANGLMMVHYVRA